jgi:hypothetical protein
VAWQGALDRLVNDVGGLAVVALDLLQIGSDGLLSLLDVLFRPLLFGRLDLIAVNGWDEKEESRQNAELAEHGNLDDASRSERVVVVDCTPSAPTRHHFTSSATTRKPM